MILLGDMVVVESPWMDPLVHSSTDSDWLFQLALALAVVQWECARTKQCSSGQLWISHYLAAE
jgi:hypothetical protein